MDIIDEIVEWHKKTFPNATLESQKKKLNEEVQEYLVEVKKGNYSGANEELADIYIVMTVLKKRFDSKPCLQISKSLIDFDKVKEKLEINKKRKWVFKNGVYHHE